MKIEIKIENKGFLRGTCGWLAKIEKKISLGVTSRGYRGVWLELGGGDEKISFLLAVNWQIYQEDEKISHLSINGEAADSYILGTDGIIFTSTAFGALVDLAQQAGEILFRLDDSENLKLSISEMVA